MDQSVRFLSPEQIRHLVEMAEQTRAALSRFVGHEVAYDSAALQLLDEWIDRHLRQFPDPSRRIRLLWASLLGEMFRRHHGGEWAVRERDAGGGMVVLCPMESGGVYTVDVSGQIGRRITQGMPASLAYFYTITSIELNVEQ